MEVNWIIAAFTIVLAFFTGLLWKATHNYAKVTKELLRQSRESFDLSRKAFLADVISRTMYCATHMRFHDRTKHYFLPYIKGVYQAVKGIDLDLAKELMEGWNSWSKGQPEEMADLYGKVPKILEKQL